MRAAVDPKGARWVRMDGLHVTLRFLGATESGNVPAVGEAMRAATDGHAPFEVTLAGAGAFPAGRRPRTLWIGIEHGAEQLGALVARPRRAARGARLGAATRGRSGRT